MKLKTRPRVAVREDDSSSPSSASRTAGRVTLAGCGLTILAALLALVEKAAFGVSLMTAGRQLADVALTVLALTSATLAAVVLLRRPATGALASTLLLLAVGQLGAAIWAATSVLNSIRAIGDDQVFFTAIGTGAYLGVLGSLVTLAGGVLAWTNRRRE